MSPYSEFENYITDKKASKIVVNPITVMFSLYNLFTK